MTKNESEIVKVEEINDANVRVHFKDGSTLRMAKRTFESGSWKRNTSLGLIRAVNG